MLVVEQGTILDRIDYNVQEAKDSMVQANVHLEKTVKVEKSSRARSLIYVLSILIFICLVLLVLKWTL